MAHPVYLDTVNKIPYFRVSQEKKALEKNPQSITGVLHLNFFANSFYYTQLKQLFRKYPMTTQWRNETHSTSLCLYDLIYSDVNI